MSETTTTQQNTTGTPTVVKLVNFIKSSGPDAGSYQIDNSVGVQDKTNSADNKIGEIFNDYANNSATGTYSHAEGTGTKASGDYSHAEGNTTTASGASSHAKGGNTIAEGQYSHAEGNNTTASGEGSHAEGLNTNANAIYSHAEGYKTQASGPYSHAEGYNTITDGVYAHAEGFGTQATGNHSHAEGYGTIAIGAGSHAEGFGTNAKGTSSHASGNGTIAENECEFVIGQYNVPSPENGNTIFTIGNGDDKDNRSNAFTVDKGGNVVASGEITATDFVIKTNASTTSNTGTGTSTNIKPNISVANTLNELQTHMSNDNGELVSMTDVLDDIANCERKFGLLNIPIQFTPIANQAYQSLKIQITDWSKIFPQETEETPSE